MKNTHRAALALGILSLVAVAANDAHSVPSKRVAAKSTTAVVEVTEVDSKNKPRVVRFETELIADRMGPKIETNVGGEHFSLEMEWNQSRAKTDSITVRVEKQTPGQPPTRLRVTTNPDPGVRKAISSLARPDGSRFEVAVTLN